MGGASPEEDMGGASPEEDMEKHDELSVTCEEPERKKNLLVLCYMQRGKRESPYITYFKDNIKNDSLDNYNVDLHDGSFIEFKGFGYLYDIIIEEHCPKKQHAGEGASGCMLDLPHITHFINLLKEGGLFIIKSAPTTGRPGNIDERYGIIKKEDSYFNYIKNNYINLVKINKIEVVDGPMRRFYIILKNEKPEDEIDEELVTGNWWTCGVPERNNKKLLVLCYANNYIEKGKYEPPYVRYFEDNARYFNGDIRNVSLDNYDVDLVGLDRRIVSDFTLYHKEKIEQGIKVNIKKQNIFKFKGFGYLYDIIIEEHCPKKQYKCEGASASMLDLPHIKEFINLLKPGGLFIIKVSEIFKKDYFNYIMNSCIIKLVTINQIEVIDDPMRRLYIILQKNEKQVYEIEQHEEVSSFSRGEMV